MHFWAGDDTVLGKVWYQLHGDTAQKSTVQQDTLQSVMSDVWGTHTFTVCLKLTSQPKEL